MMRGAIGIGFGFGFRPRSPFSKRASYKLPLWAILRVKLSLSESFLDIMLYISISFLRSLGYSRNRITNCPNDTLSDWRLHETLPYLDWNLETLPIKFWLNVKLIATPTGCKQRAAVCLLPNTVSDTSGSRISPHDSGLLSTLNFLLHFACCQT